MSITGTKGTKAISKKYPVTEGLIAETTKQTKDRFLRPEKGSKAQGEIHGS
mgnify:CR=1 FL=1